MLIGVLSRGHVLLEGLPGLGKTALVKSIGQILKLDFKRIQFTPDLMPGDVLGTHILQETSSGKRELISSPARCSRTFCSRTKSTALRRKHNPPCSKRCRKIA